MNDNLLKVFILEKVWICSNFWTFEGWHTDKKENQIFLIYREIQSGAVAKSYMRKGFLIYEDMGKYFPTLYQEQAVFGKMKMDPAKRAQTQSAGEVSSLQWFFFQSIELMTDKVWLHCIRPMLLK